MSSFNIQQVHDGYRNVVYRVTGVVDSGTTGSVGPGDIPPTMLIDVSTLNPPCEAIRIDRVKFSLPHGSPIDVQLYWDATERELAWGMGGGDDNDFWNFGGLSNNMPPGWTGDLLFATSGANAVPVTDPVYEGGPLTFAVIVECVKQKIHYPV